MAFVDDRLRGAREPDLSGRDRASRSSAAGRDTSTAARSIVRFAAVLVEFLRSGPLARRLALGDLLFRLDPSSPTLSRFGRSRRAPRHGGDRRIYSRAGLSLSLSADASLSLPLRVSLPPPQAVSQGHEITGFGWIHARWRTYVRTFDRSVAWSVDSDFPRGNDRDLSPHTADTREFVSVHRAAAVAPPGGVSVGFVENIQKGAWCRIL